MSLQVLYFLNPEGNLLGFFCSVYHVKCKAVLFRVTQILHLS